MFLVIRIDKMPPVRLTFVHEDDGWKLRDEASGLILPPTQTVGSVIADGLASFKHDEKRIMTVSVGAEQQVCSVVRESMAVDGFTVIDEDGLGFALSELGFDLLFSTAQMEAIAAWRDLSARRASRVA